MGANRTFDNPLAREVQDHLIPLYQRSTPRELRIDERLRRAAGADIDFETRPPELVCFVSLPAGRFERVDPDGTRRTTEAPGWGAGGLPHAARGPAEHGHCHRSHWYQVERLPVLRVRLEQRWYR